MPFVGIIAAITLVTAALFAAGALWVEAVVVRRNGKNIARALRKKPRPKGAPSVSLSRRMKQEGFDWLKNQNTERVTITSRDGLSICGHYLPAQSPSARCALLIHGYRGTSGREEMGWLSRVYHRMGFNVLMPDNRAHGESDGQYLGMGWLDRDDCTLWIEYLTKTQGPDAQILLHGVSMGAAAAIMAFSGRLPAAVRGVVADSGFSCLYDVLKLKARRSLRIPVGPLMSAADLWNRLRHGYSFRQVSPVEAIKAISVPVLLIHGAEDALVPAEMAQILYEAAPAEKELWLVPDAGHAEVYAVDPEGYEKKLRAFVEKVLK